MTAPAIVAGGDRRGHRFPVDVKSPWRNPNVTIRSVLAGATNDITRVGGSGIPPQTNTATPKMRVGMIGGHCASTPPEPFWCER